LGGGSEFARERGEEEELKKKRKRNKEEDEEEDSQLGVARSFARPPAHEP